MLKHLVRELIRKLGFDGMERDRLDRLRVAEQTSPTSIKILRDFFRLYVASTDRVWLLHIGANDGVKDNHTSFLRLPTNVESTLVEPQRHCLAKLSTLHEQNPRIRILPVAFGETDGATSLYHFDREFEKDIQLDVFASFDRSILEERKRYFSLTAKIVAARVETCTLRTLLTRGNMQCLDILICDIEGLDHLVINQLVATIHPLPVIIVFEQRWLSVENRRQCYQLLESVGYGIIHGTEDAWCFRLRNADEQNISL